MWDSWNTGETGARRQKQNNTKQQQRKTANQEQNQPTRNTKPQQRKQAPHVHWWEGVLEYLNEIQPLVQESWRNSLLVAHTKQEKTKTQQTSKTAPKQTQTKTRNTQKEGQANYWK